MAQLTVYIDENTFKKIHMEAKREGTSVSKWVKSKLEASLTHKGWPPGYFEWLRSLKNNPVDIELPEDIDPKYDRPVPKL